MIPSSACRPCLQHDRPSLAARPETSARSYTTQRDTTARNDREFLAVLNRQDGIRASVTNWIVERDIHSDPLGRPSQGATSLRSGQQASEAATAHD